MDYLQIVMLTLCITHVITKSRRKHRQFSSDETIENLLYFKDCQKKPKVEVTTQKVEPLRYVEPPPAPTPPPQPQCPFPKMCCALSCGDECGGGPKEPSFMSRQMEPIQRQHPSMYNPIMPMMQPHQPVMHPQIRKRKKMKFSPLKQQTPMNSRRGFDFTKQKIKSLINQDDDIRKILRDLVRVTMQKVDLMELQNGVNGRRNGDDANERKVNTPPPEPTPENDDGDDDDYFE